MASSKDQIFPPYLPSYYKLFLYARKLIRQTLTRHEEKKFKKSALTPDLTVTNKSTKEKRGGILSLHGSPFRGLRFTSAPEDLLFPPLLVSNSETLSDHINKTWIHYENDLKDPESISIIKELNALKHTLTDKGLNYVNNAGNFIDRLSHDEAANQRKTWEYCWTLKNSGLLKSSKKCTLLDIGGASTIFSFYLASLGHTVIVLDNDWSNCGIVFNANIVAKKMNWPLKTLDMDIKHTFPFPDHHFDYVFSICVLEHLSGTTRSHMMKEVGRTLKRGGRACLTMDYDSNRNITLKDTDKGLRLSHTAKLKDQIIEPSGLTITGNTEFIDNAPPQYSLAALFLTKTDSRLRGNDEGDTTHV